MNKRAIIENLDAIQSIAADFVNAERDDQYGSYGFFAICQLPDIIQQIKEELTPWYKRLWWKVCGIWRRTWRIEDEIPF